MEQEPWPGYLLKDRAAVPGICSVNPWGICPLLCPLQMSLDGNRKECVLVVEVIVRGLVAACHWSPQNANAVIFPCSSWFHSENGASSHCRESTGTSALKIRSCKVLQEQGLEIRA